MPFVISTMHSMAHSLRRRVLHCVCLALLGLLLAPSTFAQKPENLSGGEVALLPTFCSDTMGLMAGSDVGAMGPSAPRWFGLMGKGFRTMHHYCWALINVNRSMMAGVTAQQREGLITHAINDYKYVIINTEPDFVMLPDVFLRIGEAQMLLKRVAPALEAYGEAVKRKPDYWRPYGRWAEAMVTVGDTKGALAILERGIRAVPPEQTLRAQYKRLGGNLDKLLLTVPPRDLVPAPEAAAPPAAAAASVASAPGG